MITSKVKTAMLSDPEVSGLDIHVETFKGRVHLNGLVDSITESSKAEELVREVKGVVLVKNSITVK
ncbi:MAG: BON domain-containing protein [Nitrospirota bacterium]|nr:BON domain-containing protein [Nitrospirota bacterium]MDH5699595.1 BON domain-containing protein [Nitrospirota bacterium]